MNNNIQCSIESSTTSMELNSAADGIYLVPELEGLAGLPEIRTTSGVNAGYDGGWTSAQNYDARLIAIRGVIANKDIAMVEAMRRKLASLLGQGRKEQLTLRFTTEAGNAYTINVRTISCEMALQRVLNKQDFLIQLRADDPLIYDDGASGGTEAILRVQQALGGFEINFGLPLAIGGSSDATAVENGAETVYPIIKLYGPLHSPTVVNMTTNQQMQIIADLGYTINWSGWTGVSGERLAIPNELDKEAPLRLWSLDGNIEQDGTPTPDSPAPISVVTGENVVKVVGKNLLPTIIGSATRSGVTISADNGVVTATGTATADMTFTLTGNEIKYDRPYFQAIPVTSDNSILLDAGTYHFSGDIQSNNASLLMRLVDDGATLSSGTAVTANTTFTIATQKRFCIAVYVDNGRTPTLSMSNLQIEKGSTATTYEPYQGQEFPIDLGSLELAKIGTYQDRIYKDGEKWYVEKQVGKVVLNGTQTYMSYSNGAFTYYNFAGDGYPKPMQENSYGSSANILVISDHYTGQKTDYRGSCQENHIIKVTGSNDQIAWKDTRYTAPADMISWLSTHPTTVYYTLATPTTTEITNQTLIDQLEAVYDWVRRHGYNASVTGDLPIVISRTALPTA